MEIIASIFLAKKTSYAYSLVERCKIIKLTPTISFQPKALPIFKSKLWRAAKVQENASAPLVRKAKYLESN